MVVIAIALLTVVGTELAYNSRVDMQLAANQRDEVRAYFLAKSGIGLARLMLRFQRQLDNIQIPTNLLSLLGVPPQVPQPSSLSIQLWRMAKIDCHMLQGLVDDEPPRGGIGPASSSSKFEFDDEFPELGKAMATRKFGGFSGCFDVQIFDEEEKINLNKLDAPQLTSQVLLAQTLSTFGDKKYEFLFEKEDSNKVKVAPADLVVSMRDWVDEDEVQSQLNLTGQGDPFAKGFSDEDHDYDRYDPRYEAKNARFDSLDELYRVHGVNDRFMAAFRDKLTVYPDINSRLNINTDDPVLLTLAIRSVADPSRPDVRLQDPIFIDSLIQKIRLAKMFAIFGMSVVDFVNIVESAGVAVNPSIKSNPANQRYVGDKTTTFQLKSVGTAGAVEKTLTAVVRTNEGLGTLVYWREE